MPTEAGETVSARQVGGRAFEWVYGISRSQCSRSPGAIMSFGGIVAFLVLVASFVLALIGKMEIVEAAMFAGLALAILLSPFLLRWPGPTA